MKADATARKWYLKLKINVGKAAQQGSEHAVQQRFGVTRKFVRYHASKFADPTFHAGAWGGARNCAFSDADQTVAEVHMVF